jgi:hypothetical protein
MSKNTHSWYCPVYNDDGFISGWQDTLWDALRRVATIQTIGSSTRLEGLQAFG